MCTNLFFISSGEKEIIKKIGAFLDALFDEENLYYSGNENTLQGEFDSKRSFPVELFEGLIKELKDDPTLYIRVLSYEFEREYASFRVYRNKEWNIHF